MDHHCRKCCFRLRFFRKLVLLVLLDIGLDNILYLLSSLEVFYLNFLRLSAI